MSFFLLNLLHHASVKTFSHHSHMREIIQIPSKDAALLHVMGLFMMMSQFREWC